MTPAQHAYNDLMTAIDLHNYQKMAKARNMVKRLNVKREGRYFVYHKYRNRFLILSGKGYKAAINAGFYSELPF